MHILMVGVADPPPTFIARQIMSLKSLGVRTDCFPEPRHNRYLAHMLAHAGLYFHLSEQARAMFQAADIIHFQWPGHLMAYYPLARRFHKPVVVSLRGRQINIVPYLPSQERYANRLRRNLLRCDAYHCVSEDIMHEAQSFGLEPARAWVIRPAVDPDFFFPEQRAPELGPIRLLMVGALIWRKGYEYALLIMKRLVAHGTDVCLTIVGEGDDRERIAYTIQDLGLQNHVQLLGQVSPSQVLDLLRNSQAFLHTAVSEGIANVVLEAMACGLPVVSFSCGGMNEVIEHERDGFLVPVRDVDAAAQYLDHLIQLPALQQEIGARARQKVLSQFDLRTHGQHFLAMYSSMVAT